MTTKTSMDKHNQYDQLMVAFGKKRAKKISGEIKELKRENPDKAYSFIFAEDGSYMTIEKKAEEEDEDSV